jgi:phosphatidate phosphatase APP1
LNIADDDKDARGLISERLQPFLDTVLPNHTVRIDIHKTEEQTLGASSSQGISAQLLPIHFEPKEAEVVSQPFASYPSVPPESAVPGTTVFTEPEGWAIISDIDDTIKITQTPSPIGILQSTFAEPSPKAIPGMPELYAYMNKVLQTPPFFYLSASPYNRYPFLKEFRKAFYPQGTIILRDASWQNLGGLVSSLTQGTQDYKADRMVKIHSWLPKKQMVCLGDSTQKDPEAYAETAKKFPGWIKAIFIRKVTGIAELNEDEKNSNERFEKAFEGLDRNLWHVFEDPKELVQKIDQLVGAKSG